MSATGAEPAQRPLPDGFRVRLREDLRVSESGDVVMGGVPLRVLRLRPAAAALVRRGEIRVEDPTSRAVATRLLDADLARPVLDDDSPDPARLTVVIPVRDRADSLDRLLALLRPELRVVVVDDASADGHAIAEVCDRRGAQLIPLGHNVGPAAARNVGLGRVTTPLVAFVDSDVLVTASDLLALTRHFADPGLAIVAPRVVGRAPETAPRWFERYGAERGSLDLGETPSLVRRGASVSYLPSACLVAAVDCLGDGFDPKLRVGEDVDLVWRVESSGWRVRYDPDTVAAHATRSSMRTWLGRTYVYGTSGALLAARHGDRVAPAVFHPSSLVGLVALTGQRRWSLPVVGATVVYAGVRVRRNLGDLPRRDATAARLAVQGFGWSLRQESTLLLRHWWPLAAVVATRSARLRRAAAAALLADVLDRGTRREVSWPAYLLGRRLEDVAYGAGLWSGALRERSARALTPRLALPEISRRGLRARCRRSPGSPPGTPAV